MDEAGNARVINDQTKIINSQVGIYPENNISYEYSNIEAPSAFEMSPPFPDPDNGFPTRHMALDMNNIRLQVPPRKTYDHIQDKELRKKMKNRESAQAARDRKKAKMVFLENKVSELLERNRYLEEENENLRKWIQKVDTSYFWNSKTHTNTNQHIPYTTTFTGNSGISNSPESMDSGDQDQTLHYPYQTNTNNTTYPVTINTEEHQIPVTVDCMSRDETERRKLYGIKKYSGIQESMNNFSSQHSNDQNFPSRNQINNGNIISSQEEYPCSSNQDWLMSNYIKHDFSPNTRNSMDEVGPLFEENDKRTDCGFKWEANCSSLSGSPEYHDGMHHPQNMIPPFVSTLSPPDTSGESTLSSPCSSDITHGLVEENFMLQVH